MSWCEKTKNVRQFRWTCPEFNRSKYPSFELSRQPRTSLLRLSHTPFTSKRRHATTPPRQHAQERCWFFGGLDGKVRLKDTEPNYSTAQETMSNVTNVALPKLKISSHLEQRAECNQTEVGWRKRFILGVVQTAKLKKKNTYLVCPLQYSELFPLFAWSTFSSFCCNESDQFDCPCWDADKECAGNDPEQFLRIHLFGLVS